MSIKKMTHANGSSVPDEIIVDYAIRDGQGNQIDTTYTKNVNLATVATSGSYNDLVNKPITYFECNTNADIVDKIATSPDQLAILTDNMLEEGFTIYVKFINGNTAKFPTLTVDSVTTLSIVGNISGEYKWSPDAVIAFTYDGENWACIGYSEEGAVAPILANKRYMFNATGDIISNIKNRNRVSDKLSGGTIVWNQYIKNGNFATTNDWTAGAYFSVNNNIGTINASGNYNRIQQTFDIISGHKYIVLVETKINMSISYCPMNCYFGTWSSITKHNPTINEWSRSSKVFTASSTSAICYFGDTSSFYNTGEIINLRNVQVFDLTQMFGSTIADYINTLENTEEGSGVNWLKTNTHGLFLKDYYAYSTNALQSVNISKHIIYGFNAYNSSTGTALILGNKQYQITGSYTALSFTDINNTTSTITPDSNGLFTTTINGTLTVTGGDASDTCVHLVHDGSRNGEYEAYQEFTYQLDSSVQLRGLPILNSNNELDWLEPDTYESDGTVTRNWAVYQTNSTTRYTIAYSGYIQTDYTRVLLYTDIPRKYNDNTCQIFCSDFVWSSTPNDFTRENFYYSDINNGGINFVVANSKTGITTSDTVDTAKAKMKAYFDEHPITLIILQATVTTESAAPYSSEQIIPSSSFSTLRYVDAKVEAAARDIEFAPLSEGEYFKADITQPDLPITEGSYQLQYSNSTYTYSPRYITQSFKVAEGTVTSVLVDTPTAPIIN